MILDADAHSCDVTFSVWALGYGWGIRAIIPRL